MSDGQQEPTQEKKALKEQKNALRLISKMKVLFDKSKCTKRTAKILKVQEVKVKQQRNFEPMTIKPMVS